MPYNLRVPVSNDAVRLRRRGEREPLVRLQRAAMLMNAAKRELEEVELSGPDLDLKARFHLASATAFVQSAINMQGAQKHIALPCRLGKS
jgi:hypothetical protein